MGPEPFRDTILVLDEFLDRTRRSHRSGVCCPSIRLHLVKPFLDLALAHLPDGREDCELLGLRARRAGFPVVDGLGGDAHQRAHLPRRQFEPRPLRTHTLRFEPQFRFGFHVGVRRDIVRHPFFEARYLLFQGLDAPL